MSIRPFGPPRPADDRPVRAAGAICWRTGSVGLELLLVHSARWGDWSWPKGKPTGGEPDPVCAVREVLEETGVRPRLGRPLPSVSYRLPDGREKTVRYWAALTRDTGPRTALADEIAEIAWLPAADALDRLSRPGDRAPAERLLELAAAGLLDTRPLVVVRHAKARSRARWDGAEADRPLTSTGRRQARALAGLLACWEPERLLSSPCLRCLETLQPFLNRRPPGGPPLEPTASLSEDGWEQDPGEVEQIVADLIAGQRSYGGALLCSHRPVLATIVAGLAVGVSEAVRADLPTADPWLATAGILVAQVSHNPSLNDLERIQSVEIYRGESTRKSVRPHPVP